MFERSKKKRGNDCFFVLPLQKGCYCHCQLPRKILFSLALSFSPSSPINPTTIFLPQETGQDHRTQLNSNKYSSKGTTHTTHTFLPQSNKTNNYTLTRMSANKESGASKDPPPDVKEFEKELHGLFDHSRTASASKIDRLTKLAFKAAKVRPLMVFCDSVAYRLRLQPMFVFLGRGTLLHPLPSFTLVTHTAYKQLNFCKQSLI